MQHGIPKQDLQSLEKHRAEARNYRPDIEQAVINGNDPYVSPKTDAFTVALVLGTAFAACGGFTWIAG